jgi:hypothetical protein
MDRRSRCGCTWTTPLISLSRSALMIPLKKSLGKLSAQDHMSRQHFWIRSTSKIVIQVPYSLLLWSSDLWFWFEEHVVVIPHLESTTMEEQVTAIADFRNDTYTFILIAWDLVNSLIPCLAFLIDSRTLIPKIEMERSIDRRITIWCTFVSRLQLVAIQPISIRSAHLLRGNSSYRSKRYTLGTVHKPQNQHRISSKRLTA